MALGFLQQIPGDDVARLVALGREGDATDALDDCAFGFSELGLPHAAREVGCRGDGPAGRPFLHHELGHNPRNPNSGEILEDHLRTCVP